MRRRQRVDWGLAAVRLYAFLVPVQPVLFMPDGSPLRFAAAELVAPLVFLAALAWPRRRLPGWLAGVAVAIPVVALFATLWAGQERDLSYYALGKTFGLAYVAGLACASARTLGRDAVPAVLQALGAGAFWSALVGLVGFAAALAGHDSMLVSTGRLCSTMVGDPNIFCSLVAVGLLVEVGLGRRRPVARAVRLGVLAAALLATGSRSGLAGLGAGLLVLVLTRARDPIAGAVRALYGVAVAALGLAAFLLIPAGAGTAQTLWEHVWRTWTVTSRLDLYARAFEQFTDHPVLGVGIGGFNELNTFFEGGSYSHFAVHNTYLWGFVDLGLLGGTLIAGLIGGSIWVAARCARCHPPVTGAAVVAAGIATMAVFNLFIDGFYQRHFWVLVGCALALPVATHARTASVPRPSLRARAVALEGTG